MILRTAHCPRISRHLAILAIPTLTAMPLLAACGSVDADSPSETTHSETVAIPTIEAEPVNNLSDGDVIAVNLSGLDADFGYYAAICAKEKEPGNPVPDCTGDRSSAERTQHWITNKSGGTTTISPDGTASFDLGVSTVGEKANCAEQECVLKLFGDHSEGFEDIAEVPITFAK